MRSYKEAEVDPCIGFECPYCGKYIYESDALEANGEEIDGKAVQSDVIGCPECNNDVLVYRFF